MFWDVTGQRKIKPSWEQERAEGEMKFHSSALILFD